MFRVKSKHLDNVYYILKYTVAYYILLRYENNQIKLTIISNNIQ